MPGYCEIPQYRQPLMDDGDEMYDGGEVAQAGCEKADQCCICFPIASGLKIVASLSWCNTVGMFISARIISVATTIVSGISDVGKRSYDNQYHSNTYSNAVQSMIETIQSYNSEWSRQSDKDTVDGLNHAKNTMMPFVIISNTSAFIMFVASILMSIFLCCGNGNPKDSCKKMYWGAIAQFIAFLTFTCSFFFMGKIHWSPCAAFGVDALFYIYIIFVARRYVAQVQSMTDEEILRFTRRGRAQLYQQQVSVGGPQVQYVYAQPGQVVYAQPGQVPMAGAPGQQQQQQMGFYPGQQQQQMGFYPGQQQQQMGFPPVQNQQMGGPPLQQMGGPPLQQMVAPPMAGPPAQHYPQLDGPDNFGQTQQ